MTNIKEGNISNEHLNNKKFRSLGASIVDDVPEIYFEALDFSLKDQSIYNIALTGPYGSGKSTILLSYFDKKEKEGNSKKVIFVSLATFGDESKQDLVSVQKSITKQLLISDSSRLGNDASLSTKAKHHFKRYLQKNKKGILGMYLVILGFLVTYSVVLGNSLPIIGVLGSLSNLLLRYSTQMIYLNTSLPMYIMVIVLLLIKLFFLFIVLLIPLVLYIGLDILMKSFGVSIKNLKYRDVILQVEESNKDVFGQFTTQIVDMMCFDEIEVVVFEDLDRFSKIKLELLEDLRELNQHINKSFPEDRTVKFIYALHADALNSNPQKSVTRDAQALTITKFFEFIIPVSPLIDSRNSYVHVINELVSIFKDSDSSDRSRIKVLSRYITDIRILRHLKNDFEIVTNLLTNPEITGHSNTFDPTKLIAINLLRLMYPREVSDLQLNTGDLAPYLNRFEVEKTIKIEMMSNQRTITEQIKGLQSNLNEMLYNLSNSILSINRITQTQITIYKTNDSTIKLGHEKEEYSKLLNLFLESYSLWEKGEASKIDINDQHININTIFSDRNIVSNIKTINELDVAIRELEFKREEINLEITNIQYKSLNEIYLHPLLPIPSDVDILGGMISTFIREGLVDEDFHNYMSINSMRNQEGTFDILGQQDMNYVMGIQETFKENYLYKIINPVLVMEELNDKDIVSFYSLNRSMIENILSLNPGLISRKQEKYLENWMNGPKIIENLSEILLSNASIVETDLMKKLYQSDNSKLIMMLKQNNETINDYMLNFIPLDFLKNQEINSSLNSYVQDFRSANVESLHSVSRDNIIALVENLEIKFKDVSLSMNSQENEVNNTIIRRRAYEISDTNLKGIIKFKNGSNYPIMGEIMQFEEILSYVWDDIEFYIGEIYTSNKLWEVESLPGVLHLLNNLNNLNIDSDVIRSHQHCFDIGSLKEVTYIDSLIDANKILKNFGNVTLYYERLGISNNLAKFLYEVQADVGSSINTETEILELIVRELMISPEIEANNKILISNNFDLHVKFDEVIDEDSIVLENYVKTDKYEISNAIYESMKAIDKSLGFLYLQRNIEQWEDIITEMSIPSDLLSMVDYGIDKKVMNKILHKFHSEVKFDSLDKKQSEKIINLVIEGSSWPITFLRSVSKCNASEAVKLKVLSSFRNDSEENSDWYFQLLSTASSSYQDILDESNSTIAYKDLEVGEYNDSILNTLKQRGKIKSFRKHPNGNYHIRK